MKTLYRNELHRQRFYILALMKVTLFSLIAGLEEMCFMFGLDCGATILGILFDAVGARETLAIYGGLTTFMVIIFFLYIKNSKDVINEYEKLPTSECDEKCQDDGNDDGDDA